MGEHSVNYPLIVMTVGILLVLMIAVKSISKKISIPSLIGFIALGILLKLLDTSIDLFSKDAFGIFEFLAKIGLFVLLFRIGLESDIRGLLRQLRRASVIWILGVAFSGILGYYAAVHIVGMDFIPSLMVACALTATSVGVPISVWKESDALKSKRGELLLDVSEMDSISGIIIMAIIFSILPILKQSGQGSVALTAGKETLIILAKLIAFGGLCALFSLYLEERITGFFKSLKTSPQPIVVITGIGLILSALAALTGFSIAIGAFFVGLAFSRDPEAVKIDASFNMFYALFSPFFFIGVGLNIAPQSFGSALIPGLILLLAAVFGKLIGHGTPTAIGGGWIGGVLIGLSMIPRSEVTMIIMQRGLNLGDWAVPPDIFTAMVIVSAATCLIAPVFMRMGLNKWPQKE